MRPTLLLALALAGGLAAAPARAQSAGRPAGKAEAKPEAKAAATAAATAAAKPDSLALARQFTRWFYDAQWDSLIAHAPAEHHPSRDELQQQLDMLVARAGTELWVLDEKFVMRNGRPQYWRTAKFSGMEDPILLRWVIDPEGRIAGMGLGPASQAPPTDPPGQAGPAK